MTNNKTFFRPPPEGDLDIKELFRFAVSSGIGKPSETSGYPPAPWSTDELLDALERNEHMKETLDRRTVQLWFQNNNKGISAENIRWIARIFGGGDHDATTDWQVALFAGQKRLVDKRRTNGSAKDRSRSTSDSRGASLATKMPMADSRPARFGNGDALQAASQMQSTAPLTSLSMGSVVLQRGLALRTEAAFLLGSTLNIPCAIFAGAVALGFISYLLGLHDVSYVNRQTQLQQVGFLWAPNWSVLFTILLPAYFAVLLPSHRIWHDLRGVVDGNGTQIVSWPARVAGFAVSYWAVFIVCLPVAGVLQWVSVRLGPLLDADLGYYAHDWGSIAIIEPDIVSVPEAIIFTGLAYLYMSICFYLLFAALILLFAMVVDAAELAASSSNQSNDAFDDGISSIFVAVYRATILGLFIAICMKLQSAYLTSQASNILQWLSNDILFILSREAGAEADWQYSKPNHYSSLGGVDKRDSHGGVAVIQAGICYGDQLAPTPDERRRMVAV